MPCRLAILVQVADHDLPGALDGARAVIAFSGFKFSHLRRAVSRNTHATSQEIH
jgi:hypothetical protein